MDHCRVHLLGLRLWMDGRAQRGVIFGHSQHWRFRQRMVKRISGDFGASEVS